MPLDHDQIIDHVEREGWAVIPDVLTDDEVATARAALVAAAAASEARGIPTRMDILDPGGQNVRVYDLLEHDPVFVDLVAHRAVWPLVDRLLDHDAMISNFTANIALPGSGSMNAHCDQSTVMPPPWGQRHTLNAIWCLDDIDEGNGATRYLPGSHQIVDWDGAPADPKAGMRAFEASAGSVLLMDGRMWHTSGANVSADRERALLFGFYARSFLRLQNNWFQSLSDATLASLSGEMRHRLGLASGNIAYGTHLTTQVDPDTST